MKEDIKGYLAKIYYLETTNQNLEKEIQNKRVSATQYMPPAESKETPMIKQGIKSLADWSI